mgnify:CR=1 FL=1
MHLLINQLLQFLFLLCFYFLASWNFWPQLGGEYASFAFLVYVWLNFNKIEDKILLLTVPDWHRIIGRVLAPGQSCITRILCTKGKSLKAKERIHYSLILMSYMGTWWDDFSKLEQEEKQTQKKLSKFYHLIIHFFSFHLFPAFMEIVALIRSWVCAICFSSLCVT